MAVLGPSQGGTGPPPVLLHPQFRSHPWFLAKITQISNFFVFPNFRKVGKFGASIERRKAKSASAQGGFAFWPPDHRQLCPWTPLGAPTPRLPLPRWPWHGAMPLPQMLWAGTPLPRPILLITIHNAKVRLTARHFCKTTLHLWLQEGGGFASLDQWLLSSYLVGSACAQWKIGEKFC